MRSHSMRHRAVFGLVLLVLAGLLMAGCANTVTPPETPVAPTQEVAGASVLPTTVPPAPEEVAPTPTDTPVPPTATPEPVQDTVEPAEETPTNTPASPAATPEPTEAPVVAVFGQTSDGLYFRGNPDAAVTVIDYSDFL